MRIRAHLEIDPEAMRRKLRQRAAGLQPAEQLREPLNRAHSSANVAAILMDTSSPPPLPRVIRPRRELSTAQRAVLILLSLCGAVLLALAILFAGCLLILGGGIGG